LLQTAHGQAGKKIEVIEDLEEAIERGLSIAGKEDLFCITGSLYLVGEARAYLLSQG
jgi:dihydrofolate synthase/folylpolyglutamate synthase